MSAGDAGQRQGAWTHSPSFAAAQDRGPLVLVGVGIVASFLPFVPDVEVEPEWILTGEVAVIAPHCSTSATTAPRRDTLNAALIQLDAAQLSIELRASRRPEPPRSR